MNSNPATSRRIGASQVRLRRLARRFSSIYEAHKDESPEIHALGRASLPTVERYEKTFDELTIRRNVLKIETQQGRSAVGVLARAVGQWATVIVSHRPVDPEVYRASTGVTDEVIVGAERLLSLVDEDEILKSLPLAAEVRETLTPLLENAREESREAESLAREMQALERTVRELAVQVYDAIKRFRMLLRGHLGAAHRDYRSLRLRRARGEANIDDADGFDDATDVDDARDADGEAAPDGDRLPLESSVTASTPAPAPAGAPGSDPRDGGVTADVVEAPESDVA